MNRLSLKPSPVVSRHEPVRFASGAPDRGAFELDIAHQLFTPSPFESRYQYPLIIWLHSDASSEMELANVMVGLSTQNYVAISVRGTHRSCDRRELFQFGTTDRAIQTAEDSIFAAMKACETGLGINPRRVFLAGVGGGGRTAVSIGLRNPERFAGVVSVEADFPSTYGLLSRWKEARGLPLLWINGVASEGQSAAARGSTARVEDLAEQLVSTHCLALNLHPVQFLDEATLCTQRLSLMNHFLMQIVTGQQVDTARWLESRQPSA